MNLIDPGIFLQKAKDLDSNSTILRNVEGLYYARQRQYVKAEKAFKRAIELDSTNFMVYNNLGLVYSETHRLSEAEELYFKVLGFDSTNMAPYNNLGIMYVSEKRYLEAEQLFLKIIKLDSTLANSTYYNLACIRSLNVQFKQAFEYLEIALKKGYKQYEWMQEDADLIALREKKELWNELMKKYFPEKMK